MLIWMWLNLSRFFHTRIIIIDGNYIISIASGTKKELNPTE